MAKKDATAAPRSRGRRVPRLPVVVVRSGADMGWMLAIHHELVRGYARHYLGADADETSIDEAMLRTVKRCQAIENPSFDHGLRYVTRSVLLQECERILRREAPVGERWDPVLKEITASKERAIDRLKPRLRGILLDFLDGKSSDEIARTHGVKREQVRNKVYYARRRVLELMHGGPSAKALLLVLPARARRLVGRISERLAEQLAPQAFAASTLVPLLATSLAWSAGTAHEHPLPASAPLTQPKDFMAFSGGTPAVVAADTVAVPEPTRTAKVPSPPTAQSAAAPLHGAATETPDDVILTALASPADGRPELVSIGRGKSCNCSVLMASHDGGVTWMSTDGPPNDANQLVVPPTWPTDPRIFAGVDAVLGTHPYMAAAFGQPFAQLSLPPGQVAVSAHFDDGDPRLFSAGQRAVSSIRISDPSPIVAHDEVDYSVGAATTHAVAALATPAPTPGGPALLTWVPPGAAVPASANLASLDSAVMQCPVASPCSTISSLPVAPWRLVVHGSATLLAYTPFAAYASRDGGVSFNSLTLPPDTSTVDSMALGGAGFAPWMSLHRTDRSISVARLLPSGMWVDASGDSIAARTYLGQLFPVGADRIIERFGTVGYRCTSIVGGSWATRCPAQ